MITSAMPASSATNRPAPSTSSPRRWPNPAPAREVGSLILSFDAQAGGQDVAPCLSPELTPASREIELV